MFVLYCNGKYWYYELCFFYFYSHYYYCRGFFPDIIFTILFSFFRLSVLLSVMMNNIKDHLYQEFTIIHTYIWPWSSAVIIQKIIKQKHLVLKINSTFGIIFNLVIKFSFFSIVIHDDTSRWSDPLVLSYPQVLSLQDRS